MNIFKKVLLAALVMAPGGLMAAEAAPAGGFGPDIVNQNIVNQIADCMLEAIQECNEIKGTVYTDDDKGLVRGAINTAKVFALTQANPAKAFLENLAKQTTERRRAGVGGGVTHQQLAFATNTLGTPLCEVYGCLSGNIPLFIKLVEQALGVNLGFGQSETGEILVEHIDLIQKGLREFGLDLVYATCIVFRKVKNGLAPREIDSIVLFQLVFGSLQGESLLSETLEGVLQRDTGGFIMDAVDYIDVDPLLAKIIIMYEENDSSLEVPDGFAGGGGGGGGGVA